jgi:hypothetical protein
MKTALLLLLPLVVGGCAVSAGDGAPSTSSSLAETQTTYAPRYREIDRVFNHLDAADVSGCKTTFRFLNGNWMDCEVDLDASAFPLEQLSHETLPIRSFSFPTEEPDVSLEVRVEQDTVWSPLPTMRLFISATYAKVGEVTIHQMPADHYSCDRLSDVVASAFDRLSRDGTFASRMFALTGPGFEHPLATDTILGDLYVATQTASLDLAACKDGYVDEMSDSWPDPDHWISYCDVTIGGNRQALPLSNEYWSARLATLAKTDPIVVRIADAESARAGSTPTVTITYGTGGYVVELAVIDDASGEPEDASIPWDRAEGWVSKAFSQIHELTWSLLLKESERSTLLPGEKVEGRLVLRDQKLDVD